jgi:enoyl-CoA hydratase/carnithine racemase
MNRQDIVYEKDRGIATARVNRPERLNAFRTGTYQELLAVLDDVARDEGIRVLVITGTGRAFSAGDDLKELHGMLNDTASAARMNEMVLSLQEITRRIAQLPSVVIAAVNGIAVGFGVELALAADIRLASDDATFTFAEAKRGLFVTNGAVHLLPRLIGLGRALHMTLTGGSISAAQALAHGLVTGVFPRDDLTAETREVARAIAANAPTSARLLKQHLRSAFELDLEQAMRLEIEATQQCAASGESAEGVQSFLARRPAAGKDRTPHTGTGRRTE